MNQTIFSKQDHEFMQIAYSEAQKAMAAGDYPVGAVLTLNGEFFASGRNALFSTKVWSAHAEHSMIANHSAELGAAFKSGNPYELHLYTTLEPCLMCLGIAKLHRVSRIVYACPDPHGGTSQINPEDLGVYYKPGWPKFEMGLMKREVCDLIIEFLKLGKFSSWEEMLKEFEAMRHSWAQD